MKIFNVVRSINFKKVVCKFDFLLDDGIILFQNVSLYRIDEDDFAVGLTTSIRPDRLRCTFLDLDTEQKIIDLILKQIPEIWIDETEILDLTFPNYRSINIETTKE